MSTCTGQVVGFRPGRVSFLELQTSDTDRTIQLVCTKATKVLFDGKESEITKKRFGFGCLIRATGTFQPRAQKSELEEWQRYMNFELLVDTLESFGELDQAEYPVVPSVSLDTLRKHPTLRCRDPRIQAVMRIRSATKLAIATFMAKHKVYQVDTPILTADDCEGAGEVFAVEGSQDFFSTATKVGLTVSGQLDGEAAALGLGQIYTMGPTFRAEHSDTTRHLSEFWMVEPELCFISFEELQQFTVKFLKAIVAEILDECFGDLVYLQLCHRKAESKDEEKETTGRGYDTDLISKLEQFRYAEVTTIRYREALVLLQGMGYPELKFGDDLESEMEKKLTSHFKGIVVVTHYPKSLKSFYMIPAEDDPEVVEAMDVLAPGIGEIVGGSMREHRYEALKARMEELQINIPWYLDLRKWSTAPHGGFGLGFERMVMYLTGMKTIHDVIFRPRSYKKLT